jgi:hypothetical protein
VAEVMSIRQPFASGARVKFEELAQGFGDDLYKTRFDAPQAAPTIDRQGSTDHERIDHPRDRPEPHRLAARRRLPGQPSEQNGIVQLLSASQGIGFAVRFGNRRPSRTAMWISPTAAPAGPGPIARRPDPGVECVAPLCAVVAAGRVLADGNGRGGGRCRRPHLRSQLELWDRLLQEFIVYLREYSQQAAQLQAQAAAVDEAPVL